MIYSIAMIAYLKELLFSETGKDTLVVFIGTLINIVAAGIFFILAPRILGPTDFGLFSTVVATALMVSSIANFGLDTGILRFAGQNMQAILSLALKSYFVLGVVISTVGIILSPLLANFLNNSQLITPLRIAFATTIFVLLTNFFVAALQAQKEFLKATIVNLSANMARVILLIVSSLFLKLGLFELTLIFFGVMIVSVFVGKLYMPFSYSTFDSELVKKYFKFNFFIAAALIISSIPYDNYFLLKISGPLQAGLYAAPFKLLNFIYQFGGNFSRVLASRFASFDTREKVLAFSKKTLPIVILFVFGLLVLILISNLLIPVLFGKEFNDSVLILQILTVGFIFFFASTIPSAIILYYLGKSNISFVITCIRYLLFVILLVLLVPSQKAKGAAVAFSLTELASLILMTFYVFLKFQKSNVY